MKRVISVLVPLLACSATLYGQGGGPGPGATAVDVTNQIDIGQDQSTTAIAEGGSNWNDNASSSNSQVNINTNSVSNYRTRTPPLTTFPPYLPYWTHGGWGTIKAYFPNGPTPNDGVYETAFDPTNEEDMRELRGVLTALPHKGPLEVMGSVLNGVAVALGRPDMYHHGRGFQIANSILRDHRPQGKPLLVFIDSNVDPHLLAEEGYAYVGKVSIEGDVQRNWDHVYKAAAAEALLWDVDLLLVAGGMKGVTVGSNVSFPSAAGGYAQASYSLSLFGAMATGITEGKGKAVLSAEAYRFAPRLVERRRIPEALYERIRARGGPAPAPAYPEPSGASIEPGDEQEPQGERIPQDVPEGTGQGELLLPRLGATRAPPHSRAPAAGPLYPDNTGGRYAGSVRPRVSGANAEPGIEVSRELLNMAGFQDVRTIKYLTVR